MQMITMISLFSAFAGILVTASPIINPRTTTDCASGKPFTGQAGCSTCMTEGNIVCGRDEDRITDLICTKFSTGLIWVPVDSPGKCGVDAPVTKKNVADCPSGKPFTGQAGCSTCMTEGNIVCGRDEDRVTDLICTKFSTGLIWVPVDSPGKCGVDAPAPEKNVAECPSGKPFTGQAGCSTCMTEGNIVCGRDEDRVTDLICTKFSTGLIWVPVDSPGKCGVDTPAPAPAVDGSCPSGKPFDATRKACNMCATEGNVVCGLDGNMKADLKCTKVEGSLIWVATGGKGCGW